MNLDMEDKSPPLTWWMQNVQLTSDTCHASSNPNCDSFAGSALTSTAVLCAQVWHSPGVSPAQKLPASHPHDGSSLHRHSARSVTPVKAAVPEPANVTGYPQCHQHLTGTHPLSFRCRGTLPLCSGCAFITAQTGSLGQPSLYPDGLHM